MFLVKLHKRRFCFLAEYMYVATLSYMGFELLQFKAGLRWRDVCSCIPRQRYVYACHILCYCVATYCVLVTVPPHTVFL